MSVACRLKGLSHTRTRGYARLRAATHVSVAIELSKYNGNSFTLRADPHVSATCRMHRSTVSWFVRSFTQHFETPQLSVTLRNAPQQHTRLRAILLATECCGELRSVAYPRASAPLRTAFRVNGPLSF